MQESALSQNGYSDDSISAKGERQGLRDRPATLLGFSDERGAFHALMEIVANSLDEARQGHGKSVEVIITTENEMTVIDHGRGVPMGWNSKAGRFNWELVFCELYASGKGAGTAYNSSEGLNGIGATAANYTSDYMNVVSCRVNDEAQLKRYKVGFVNGEVATQLTEDDWDGGTGTMITFKPSETVFTRTKIPFDAIIEKFRKKAMIVPAVRLTLQYGDSEPASFYYERGMVEYLENVTVSPINKEIIHLQESTLCNDSASGYDPEKNYNGSVEIALAFSAESSFIEAYHNGAVLGLGGVTKDAVLDAVLKVFEKEAKEKGKIDKQGRISKRDIEDLVSAIIETRCPGDFSMFEHQTKEAITNPSLYKLTFNTVMAQLAEWGLKHRREFDAIFNRILLNKEIREKAESVKKGVLKQLTADIHKSSIVLDKFLPCEIKDPNKAEIYIVEGDSAGGTIVLTRLKEFQALYKLMGKIPNCIKKSLESLLKPDSIIVKLFMVFGCGIELKSKYITLPKFDIKKLNYHKIIIATDADVDGGHITTLLLIMIYILAPSLIKAGNVYMAISPLFIITLGKSEAKERRFYAYDEEERDEIIRKLVELNNIPRSKIDVQRSKGLGENSEEVMLETVLDPKTRKLQQVIYPENDEHLWELCNALLGTDIDSRKRLIEEYFDKEVITEY